MKRFNQILFYLLLLLLPSQLGLHFWLSDSLVLGRQVDYLSPTLYVTDVIVWAVVITGIWLRRQYFFKSKILKLVLIAFPFFIFWSHVPHFLLRFYFWGKLSEFLLLGWVIVRQEIELEKAIRYVSFASMWSVVVALGQFLHQGSLGGLWYFLGERLFYATTAGIAQVVVNGRTLLRPYATFPHPNVLGGFLISFLPLVLWQKNKASHKISFIIQRTTIMACVVGIFLSFSRVSWLALAGVSASYLFFQLQLIRVAKKKIFLICVFLITLFAIEELVLGRFSSLLVIDQESITGRQKLLHIGFTLFSQFPIVGAGVGSFISLIPHVAAPPYLLQPVHSIYVLLAAESGLVGLGLFSWFLFSRIYKLFQEKNYPLVSSLLVIAGLGLFDHYFLTLQQTQLWLTLVLAFASNKSS